MKLTLNYKKKILCAVTGLLAVFAFPKFDLFFLIWIAFLPLISVVVKSKTINSFFYGFFSGFVFNVMGLYWLVPMLQFNTGSLLQAVVASCVLWSYLALYWGIWSLYLNLSVNIKLEVIKNKFYSNILIIFFNTSFWVFLEYIRTYFIIGFPWMLIGYSQFKFIEIIQIAEFTGIYGVSFLIMFCNLCFYFWIFEKKGVDYFYVVVLILIAVWLFGIVRVDKFKFCGEKEFSVSIVQPNIEQSIKWVKSYEDNILFTLKKYASEISKIKTDLVLWPESAITGFIPYNEKFYNKAKKLVSIAGGLNIIGTPYNEGYKTYNAVLYFENAFEYKTVHKKNHLLPFGEFIPFRKFLAKFLGALNNMGDFERGKDTNVFSNGEIYVGSIICSENFLPDISRKFVLSGAKVITNHTNDAWFFDTAAPYQHFIMNVFRAIENRKAVLVSANSGISGIIEASGLIVNMAPCSKEALIRGVFFQNNFRTFYTKHGDVFVYVCMGVVFAMIMFLCALF
ncbi:MAG: apolipoprotein N-acyltransferase [Endomicrobium sp.]|jgi:apolipoprotein N-acyltransferase|nr:apolipoprotein N-acyltransferase [Endomicrobium sp.]